MRFDILTQIAETRDKVLFINLNQKDLKYTRKPVK